MLIGLNCIVGSVIHEIGHIIGFCHQHSRDDRDKHVFVNYSKIPKSQWKKYSIINDYSQSNYYSVPYDLFSIMHYTGDDKISARDSKRSFLMGQRTSLSYLDAKMANLAYKCSGKCI